MPPHNPTQSGRLLDDLVSSYRFHQQLESPVAFLREEWRSLLIFGGAFVAILLVGIYSVDPAFFYSRLITDPLLYYQKAVTFATTGHVDARNAINVPPFRYVGMPGFLRSPFILAFADFDDQLRAMQVANIALLALMAAMYAYVLSWVVDPRRRWIAIGFCFGFMLLSPQWLENVFLPLADSPYAVCTTATLILLVRILATNTPVSSRKWEIAAAAVLFVIAFLVKYTAPVLILFAATLIIGRVRTRGASPRVLAAAASTCVAVLAVLVALNWDTILHRYLWELTSALRITAKGGMLLNLTANALPLQILPIFDFAFANQPLAKPFSPVFGATARDSMVAGIGICTSAIIFAGMWRGRHRFMPEIVYFLSPFPVLILLIPSTARYLMPYQPFIWIFFLLGVAPLLRPIVPALKRNWTFALAVAFVFLVAMASAVYFRAERVSGTMADGVPGVPLARARDYTRTVSSEFRDLRKFLESLPRQRTLLVAFGPMLGRWKVISGVDYYNADDTLAAVAKRKDTYLLVECGTIELCAGFEHFDQVMRGWVGGDAVFEFQPVFERQSPYARIVVYRLNGRARAISRSGPP